MKSLVLPFIVSLPLLGVFACGSNKKSDSVDPLATVSGFCLEWSKVACSEDVVRACQASDAEDCQETQAEFCEALVPRGSYDSANATDCLQAVEKAYADAELEDEELLVALALGGDCATLLKGSADEGDDCSEDSDCDTTSGYACVKRPGKTGTCQVPEEVDSGRSCSAENAVCKDADFYCDGKNCVERLGENESCMDTFECAADLRCEGVGMGEGGASSNASETGTCVPRADDLEPCDTHDDCESGFCYDDGSAAGECLSLIVLGRKEPLCDELR